MEIVKPAPWSRIKGQNSVNKEVLEIVGNGKLTGSVLKDTIAFSGTIWRSVQKPHSRNLLQDLLHSRVWKMPREPEVPEAEVPSGRMFRLSLQGLLQRNLPQFILWKSGTHQNACCTSPRMDADLGKSALMRVARLMNSPAKGVQRMMTKVQWLCWKLHDNCPGEPHQRKLQCSKIWGSVSGGDRVARARCPWSSVEVGQKYPKKLKEKHKTAFFSPSENWCLLAPSNPQTWGTRTCCRLRSVDAHDQHKGLEFCWNGYFDDFEKSYDGHNSQWWSADAWRATLFVKELEKFLTMKLLEDTPAVLSLRKLCDEHGYSYEWINGQKPHLNKNGIRIQCNTENFVPIVVPDLSTSSSSSLLSSTSMTPSRQEIDHLTSSSRSSTSPTMTSSTVSSDSVVRQERRDPCGIDHYPATVSSKHVERHERGDPCSSGIPEEQVLTKPTKNPKPNKNEDHDQVRRDPCHSDMPEWLQEFRENLVDDRVLEHRDSHASSSHELSSEPTPARSVDLCKHSVKTHFPKDRNCEICQRTKITRAPCRRRIGGVVLRAENFGDLTAADHKVLSENCESRNNHRYAVVVQDLATQRIQSYPCKAKTSQETAKELAKVLGAN